MAEKEPKPQRVHVADRFEVCPECGYAVGFHVRVQRLDAADGPNA